LDPVEVVYFEQERGVPLLRNEQVVKRPAEPAELTEAYTDEAIRFMREHKDRPFFIYLPHTMAHVPMGVSREFAGTSRFGLYGDVIKCLDHHVGRLFDSLDELGVADNTLVLYASDNGRGPGRNPDQPLRGNKLTTREAGIRVPGIVWGPGLGVTSNTVCSELVHAMDWYPTLATFAEIPIPEGVVLDGRDISPLLAGETQTVPRPEERRSLNAEVPLRRPWDPPGEWADIVSRDEFLSAFFYHGSLGELAAVRWGPWKMRLNPDIALYNLRDDPGETTPVRNANVIRKLRGMVFLFQEEMRTGSRPAGDASKSQ
jgi:arylsulfatase A-like enzyme